MNFWGNKRFPDWVKNSIKAFDDLLNKSDKGKDKEPPYTIENLVKFLNDEGFDVSTRHSEFPAQQAKLEALLKEDKTFEQIKVEAEQLGIIKRKNVKADTDTNTDTDTEVERDLEETVESKMFATDELIKKINAKRRIKKIKKEIENKKKEIRKRMIAKMKPEELEAEINKIYKEVIKNRLRSKLKAGFFEAKDVEMPPTVKDVMVEETRQFKKYEKAPPKEEVSPAESAKIPTPEQQNIVKELEVMFDELELMDKELHRLNAELEEVIKLKNEEYAEKIAEKGAKAEELLNKTYDVLKQLGINNDMIKIRENKYFGIWEKLKGIGEKKFTKEDEKTLERLKEAKLKIEKRIKKFKEENGKYEKLLKEIKVFVYETKASLIEIKAAEIDNLNMLEKLERILKELANINKDINFELASIV